MYVANARMLLIEYEANHGQRDIYSDGPQTFAAGRADAVMVRLLSGRLRRRYAGCRNVPVTALRMTDLLSICQQVGRRGLQTPTGSPSGCRKPTRYLTAAD